MFTKPEKVLNIVLPELRKNLFQRVQIDVESLQKGAKSWVQLHVKRTSQAPGIGTSESRAVKYFPKKIWKKGDSNQRSVEYGA